MFHLTDGLAAFHSNGKLADRFGGLHSHQYPGALEYDRPDDPPTSRCDGELKRSATRNRASGFQKQAAKTDVLGDGSSLSDDAPGWEHDVDEVLEDKSSEFPFLRGAHRSSPAGRSRRGS